MGTNVVTIRAFLGPAALMLLSALGGCGGETPPYEALPLRDALSAAPEVLASLPEQTRRDVALRLEDAHEAAEEITFASAEVPSVSALVGSADARREENGSDAIVLGALEPLTGGFLLRSVATGTRYEGPVGGLALKGPAADSTANLENAALGGRAGAILVDLAKRSQAQELVRITGLPAGVVVMNQSLYVNASWLVALSALEPPEGRVLRAQGAPVVMETPQLDPMSVRVNPYNLPSSIAECAFDVQDVCICAGSGLCDHERTDPTFASAQEECEWVNADPKARAEALCVLALMSIDAIRECVLSAGSTCTQLPIGNRDDALAFVADATCMDIFEICLRGGPSGPSSSGSSGSSGCGSSSSNSSGGCSSCDRSCDNCNEDCSKCNDNCAECNENTKNCNDNCKQCDENRKSCGNSAVYGGSTQCRVSEGARFRSGSVPSAPVPVGTAFWLLAPAGYILRRIRRRA